MLHASTLVLVFDWMMSLWSSAPHAGVAYGEMLNLDGYDAFGNAANTVRRLASARVTHTVQKIWF